MFNKKLYLVLVFLLFILHISFVSAVEVNETGIIENGNDCVVVLDDNKYNFVSDLDVDDLDDDSYDVTIIDFNQGDKIPISIDSSVEGDMTVLVDDKIYGEWSFSKNETILIPTYNPDSFYDDAIKNIDVGNHKLSLIFNLNTFNNYIPLVSEEDSHLHFQFSTYNETILNNKYIYMHNSELTIFEKEKTIELSIIPYDELHDYSDEVQLYFAGVVFNVIFENINEKEILGKGKYTGYSFGLTLSDLTEILFKKDMDIGEAFYSKGLIGETSLPEGIYCNFVSDFSGLSYDVLCNRDVCNLTVINFMDGTRDSVLFNMSKFYKYVEKIDYIVDNNDVTFRFYQYIPKVFISIDERGEFVLPKDNQWNVTFSNLSYGAHVMSLYGLKSDYSKELLCKLTFEIKNLNPVDSYNNTLNIPTNNIYFNLFPSMLLTAYGGFLVSNLNNTILNIGGIIIDNSNYEFSEHKLGEGSSFESKSQGSNSIGSGSSEDSSNNKVYEISEKSVSKSIDDLLTKLGLTIFSCMSLMGGYVRFKKNQ